jgi:hypothetical protein
MPYSHFYGYLHLTLRTQDFHVNWQWDEAECLRFTKKRISIKKISEPDHKFKGRLAPRRNGGFAKEMLKEDEEFDAYEGGSIKAEEFNPYDFI